MVPLLEDVKRMFGKPRAIVTDMGKAMLNAVAEVFPDVRNFICHFHFLRDLGKDLCDKEYAMIRNRLKTHGVTTQLRYRLRLFEKNQDNSLNCDKIPEIITTQQFPENTDVSLLRTLCYVVLTWVLDGKNQGNGFGFPFDHPHLIFYQRLNTGYETLEKIRQLFFKTGSKGLKPVLQLLDDVQPIIQDSDCKNSVPLLLQKIAIFHKLREAMRLTLPDTGKGLNDNGQDADITTIEQGVKTFRKGGIHSEMYRQHKDYQKMIEQIDTYWEKLFADPISIETRAGTIIIQPQRTNNILERFFRSYRKSCRRKSGNNKMTKILQTMLADTPVVKNLENPEYRKILLNGKTSLEERFAEIDAEVARDELKRAKNKNEKIPNKLKKIIRSKENMRLFLNLF